ALPGVGIQIPPNLNSKWQAFISYGADDLGGISQVTEDYINPGYAWPRVEDIKSTITGMGLNLRERLPIYPSYIKKGWYSSEIASLIEGYADEDGLVKDVPTG
ncbi:MAG: 7,8-didemethyl-8-hydroxy-5-deazariboflavin synthase subunit CofG, partial [Candidatus Hydrothermarchaeaceae archaeon]